MKKLASLLTINEFVPTCTFTLERQVYFSFKARSTLQPLNCERAPQAYFSLLTEILVHPAYCLTNSIQAASWLKQTKDTLVRPRFYVQSVLKL